MNINIILVFAVFISMLGNISLLIFIKNLNARNKKMQLHNQDLTRSLANALEQANDKNIENTQGFVQFLSSSRDNAYTYIEMVQDALKQFDSEINADVEYFNKYGMIDMDTPSREILTKIIKSYSKIKELLPK